MHNCKIKLLPIIVSVIALMSTTKACLAQDTESKSSNKSDKSSSKVLDSDSLFGGIDFVKGMNKGKSDSSKSDANADEIEGEVIVTTNPYNSIPEPTGLVFGAVYEPSKDGKPPKNSSTVGMLTGLTLLMGAMQANAQAK